MLNEPPPRIKDFTFIWTRWIYNLWEALNGYIDGVLCAAYCLKHYREVVATNATATGTVSVDLKDGNVYKLTLTGNTTLTFDNPVAAGFVSNLTFIIIQDATGGRTLTFPSSVKWDGGTAPSPTTTAAAISVWTLFTEDGGTTWHGFMPGGNMS